jgi:hypothetical protein
MATTTIRNHYETTAVIDWIDLVITTRRPTQFQHIQRQLGGILQLSPASTPIYVEALEVAQPNDPATRFRLRLHDAPANSLSRLERIATELNLACVPAIFAIEIALDFYHRTSNSAELLTLTRRLMQSLAA